MIKIKNVFVFVLTTILLTSGFVYIPQTANAIKRYFDGSGVIVDTYTVYPIESNSIYELFGVKVAKSRLYIKIYKDSKDIFYGENLDSMTNMVYGGNLTEIINTPDIRVTLGGFACYYVLKDNGWI